MAEILKEFMKNFVEMLFRINSDVLSKFSEDKKLGAYLTYIYATGLLHHIMSLCWLGNRPSIPISVREPKVQTPTSRIRRRAEIMDAFLY